MEDNVLIQNMQSWDTLADSGFMVEQLVEETDQETLSHPAEISSKYYTSFKAQKFPQSFVMKARKI